MLVVFLSVKKAPALCRIRKMYNPVQTRVSNQKTNTLKQLIIKILKKKKQIPAWIKF